MMKVLWYERSGKRVSEKRVRQSKDYAAEAKRTGKMGPLICSIQSNVANRIDQMTLIEFANWSGNFTCKHEESKK